MNNIEFFKEKEKKYEFLNKLSKNKKNIIISILDEIREIGYNDGKIESESLFQDEISYRGWK
jgi:hypothetical protein